MGKAAHWISTAMVDILKGGTGVSTVGLFLPEVPARIVESTAMLPVVQGQTTVRMVMPPAQAQTVVCTVMAVAEAQTMVSITQTGWEDPAPKAAS